jgi:predicted RNA-binding protein with PIN domain
MAFSRSDKATHNIWGLSTVVKLYLVVWRGQRFPRDGWRYHDDMRWLVDGYNVIRRSPELRARELQSLEAGRRALTDLLGQLSKSRGEQFVVVFDGSGGGGSAGSAGGVRVVFSSARDSADRVLARMASQGGAVVSNDREVRQAAVRAGAVAITADQFLARLERDPSRVPTGRGTAEPDEPDARGPKKGNPRRLSKKDRAAARALGRLGPR